MKLTLLSFRIIAVFNVLLAFVLIGSSMFFDHTWPFIILGVITFAIGGFVEKARADLIATRYWAWVAGLVVSGFYTLSVFFPLGIMGFIGLLKPEVRRLFEDADRANGSVLSH